MFLPFHGIFFLKRGDRFVFAAHLIPLDGVEGAFVAVAGGTAEPLVAPSTGFGVLGLSNTGDGSSRVTSCVTLSSEEAMMELVRFSGFDIKWTCLKVSLLDFFRE